MHISSSRLEYWDVSLKIKLDVILILIQSRTTRASDQSQKPGPGTHSPEKVLLHLPRPPAFSLGIRHSEFITPLVVVVTD